MYKALLYICIFLPIFGGALVPLIGFKERRTREPYVLAVVIATSAISVFLSLKGVGTAAPLAQISSELRLAFKVDELGRVFALLVSLLWPFASLYAFEYMEHEERKNSFFCFYTMSFGIALGIAYASNLITMYLFYELLTILTLPLIMHERGKPSQKAGIQYIVYSIGGATAALIGIVLFCSHGGIQDYVFGGTWRIAVSWTGGRVPDGYFFLAFILMFFGFGVKAAVFPLHDWLPSASVAPTPVTALLHAVAVVKAGVFAIIRVSYYSFGAELLHGTWAQAVAMFFAAVTIIYGSSMALKEQHIKRRLAYSTVANLSYIILGAMIFTPAGLSAGLTHMLFHGVMKISLFFVAGILNVKADRFYVNELAGLGHNMPLTFGAFTVAGLALIGIPPLNGFYSKFAIASAAAADGSLFDILGIAALMISAVLTAIYLMTIIIPAFFPPKDINWIPLAKYSDPNWYMILPLAVFSVAVVLLGMFPGPVLRLVTIW